MKKIITGLVLLAVICACSDDNEDVNKFDASVVQKAENFVDFRDNTEYSCVRIGNQIWMTENFRYLLPQGPLDGCYTWGEEPVALSSLSVINSDFAKAALELGNNKAYNWTGLYGKWFVIRDLQSMLDGLTNGYFTQNVALDQLRAAYPLFYKELLPELDLYKGSAALAHLKKQELVNGNYSKDNGYLYTLEAAKKAVPVEGGWRLPTDEDWLKLEATIGMNSEETNKLEAWRGVKTGTLLKKGGATGLNIRLSGGNLYTIENGDLYLRRNEYGYYWTSTVANEGLVIRPNEEGGVTVLLKTTVIMRSFASYSDKIWRGTLRVNGEHNPVKCSVRLVRDAN